MKVNIRFTLFLTLLLISITLYSQSIQQRVPDPNTGDLSDLRWGTMDGNRINTLFKNWGEIAHYHIPPAAEWPKGSGHQYSDGVALIISVATDDENGKRIHHQLLR